MKTIISKTFILTSLLGALMAAPFMTRVALGDTFYWNDSQANKQMTNNDNWSLSATEQVTPASGPGANDDLIFNINALNSANTVPHLAGGIRDYNSLTFRSTGTTQIDGSAGTSTSDRQLRPGSGGLILESGAGAVTIGRDGHRVFMRAGSTNQPIVNNSSDLTFNWNYAPGAAIEEFTTTTITVSGSGSGGVHFSRIVDATDKPMALTINSTGTGVTTLGETTAAFPHNYTGDTTVQSGHLRIDGTISESDVTVQSGGTISGAGTIDNDLTFDGGQFDFSTSLTLNVGGAVSFSSAFGIANVLADWDNLDLNESYTLIAGTINTANLANLGSGNAIAVGTDRQAYFEENSLSMVVIPEPTTLAFLSLALGAGLLFRRRYIA